MVTDWDGDGYVDLIGLNHGLNSRFRASTDQPARLWVSDFDENGSVEQILTTYNGQDSSRWYCVIIWWNNFRG